MNWKADLKLSDLDSAAPVEIACRRCGQTRTEPAAALMRCAEFKQAYLDEVESALKCANRTCRGPVRIALIHDGKALSAGWRDASRLELRALGYFSLPVRCVKPRPKCLFYCRAHRCPV